MYWKIYQKVLFCNTIEYTQVFTIKIVTVIYFNLLESRVILLATLAVS